MAGVSFPSYSARTEIRRSYRFNYVPILMSETNAILHSKTAVGVFRFIIEIILEQFFCDENTNGGLVKTEKSTLFPVDVFVIR